MITTTDDIRNYVSGRAETLQETEDWKKIDSYSMAWIELILPDNLIIL